LYTPNPVVSGHSKEIFFSEMSALVNSLAHPSHLGKTLSLCVQSGDAGRLPSNLNDFREMTQMVTQVSAPGEADEELVLGGGERRMVQLIALGVPDREIAQELGVSESQVRDQLLVIFKKLAVAGLLDQLLYIGEA
jgi:DNA-binding NarL/FixJ family response regulator